MTASTKMKVKVTAGKVKRVLKDWIAPVFIGGTIGAAWYGWWHAIKHEVQIDTIKKNEQEFAKAINANADVLQEGCNRIDDLERRQLELFEQALKQTEGKAE